MNVTLQRFTRTLPSAMARLAEGEEVGNEVLEEEDELAEKINLYYDDYHNNTKTLTSK